MFFCLRSLANFLVYNKFIDVHASERLSSLIGSVHKIMNEEAAKVVILCHFFFFLPSIYGNNNIFSVCLFSKKTILQVVVPHALLHAPQPKAFFYMRIYIEFDFFHLRSTLFWLVIHGRCSRWASKCMERDSARS